MVTEGSIYPLSALSGCPPGNNPNNPDNLDNPDNPDNPNNPDNRDNRECNWHLSHEYWFFHSYANPLW